jgi:hypothetical protein
LLLLPSALVPKSSPFLRDIPQLWQSVFFTSDDWRVPKIWP